MRLSIVAIALAMLFVPASAAAAGGSDDGAERLATSVTECAPPCGEINPRLIFEFPDLTREPMEASAGDEITFEGTVTYWFDMDDEGYSPPDPQSPIVIRFSFPRTPDWAEMSVEPTEIPVDVSTCPTCVQPSGDDPSRPQVHYEYTRPVNLTVEVLDTPEPTPGYNYGKLQVFAKSTESGIYNPGYGIREVRLQASEDLQAASTDEEPSDTPFPGTLVALAALGATAAAAIRRAR